MPRTEEQYEAMRIATKEKIHSAAIKLFGKKGFAGTSVKDIAGAAEISIGLMYRHYKNKGNLFNDLILYASEGLNRTTEKFQNSTSPEESIKQFTLEVLNDFNKDDEYAYFQMLMNQAVAIEDASSQIKNLKLQSDKMLDQTVKLIERGQKLNQFKQGNAAEQALFFYSTIQGMAMMKINMGEQFVTPSLNIVMSFLIEDCH